MQDQDFTGQNVLITGAAGGIGRALSKAFLSRNASVIMVDADPQLLSEAAQYVKAATGRLLCIKADVSQFESCCHVIEQVTRQLGPVSVLINNAGISPKHQGKPADISSMDPQEWYQVISVNLHGAFHFARLITPEMIARKSGRIINMSSVAGSAYLPIVAAHYATSKAALIGFTRHLAGELGTYNITVNALSPGRIETPMVKSVADELNEAIVKETPLNRLGRPEEVAQAAIFLASDYAHFITGQVIDISGGWLMR